MNNPICLLAALLATIAAPSLGAAAPRTLLQGEAQSPCGTIVGSNGDVERFYGVPISLTVSGVQRLPYQAKVGQEKAEDDLQTIATITAKHGVQVKVVFGESGALYLAETETPNAHGPKAVGVGSLLSDVKRAWPMGKLFYGDEGGRFVTFDTGTNALYNFDPAQMPPETFDRPAKDVVIPNLRVKRLRVFAR